MLERIIEAATLAIPDVMPDYHPDAADVNEAIDTGVASCAARAYLSTILLRGVLTNTSLYGIDFGYAPEHGDDYDGHEGTYIKMGHAVGRLYVPEKPPLILESYNDGSLEVVAQDPSYNSFMWSSDPKTGYREYLTKADLDVELNDNEIIRCFYKQLQRTVA